jgi:signal transduction histidine kinase
MWKNILCSGNNFGYDEKFLKYKFKLINIILITAIFTSFLMAIVFSFIGTDKTQMLVITLEIVYGSGNLGLFLFLRQNKNNLKKVIYIGMMGLYLLQVIIMINIVEDSSREAWYFLTIIVSFFLAGRKFGFIMLSIIFITMTVYNFQSYLDTNLNTIESIIPIVLLLLIGFVMNLSEIIKENYEESLQKSNQLLQRKIEELNKFNINLESRVDQEVKLNGLHELKLFEQSKLVSMGEMIGNIAHQWRQPLSVISTGATGMKLQKEYNLLSDENFNKTCDAINDNAQYLSKTIDDFKNFVKGDREKKLFKLENDINSFLHLVEGTIKSNNIVMIIDLNDQIQIIGYENELLQCFINIFNNAKDALIEQKISNKFIFICTFIENGYAIIKIKDNAGGIPDKNLTKVFEPYFTTKHKSQGTGIGLHMTYNLIVDSMKGTIECSNVHYKYKNKSYIGAEVMIRIPMC